MNIIQSFFYCKLNYLYIFIRIPRHLSFLKLSSNVNRCSFTKESSRSNNVTNKGKLSRNKTSLFLSLSKSTSVKWIFPRFEIGTTILLPP